jgi:hypothetical protein
MITVAQVLAAKQAAVDAATVYYRDTMKGQDRFACGFAWVEVKVDRTNSKQALELIKAGFKKDYKPRTLSMWNPSGLPVQNIDTKEVGAHAMAKVLSDLGLNAFADSRMD